MCVQGLALARPLTDLGNPMVCTWSGAPPPRSPSGLEGVRPVFAPLRFGPGFDFGVRSRREGLFVQSPPGPPLDPGWGGDGVPPGVGPGQG